MRRPSEKDHREDKFPEEELYNRLVRKDLEKVAKTLYLNASNFEALVKKCEEVNIASETWNQTNQKLSKEQRQPKRKKIKPCDVIDDLIARHLKGGV